MSETAPAPVISPAPAGQSGQPTARFRPPADSLWWPALAAALFACVQLVFVAGRLGLSWDEVVYVSQVSMHAPAAYFDPARARGIPVLVAPVTLLTSSVLAMRVYLALASGLGLYLALLAWRGLRPAWMLGLAGGLFGSLWVAEYYGPQAMPDLWVALSSLAAVGLFLRAVHADDHRADHDSADGDSDGVRGRPVLRWVAGMAGCLAVAALVRPGDAVFLAAGLVVAVVVVRAWRRWELIAGVAVGLAAGCVEWLVEAYARFGGPLERLHAAGAEQGGFGLHFAIWDELVAANGPTLCRPCTIGLRYPELSLWWLALPVLAVVGVLAARKAGHLRSSLLAAACGLCVAFQYLFLIDYAAPRFLLPAYALAAIPVADGLGWLLTGLRADRQPLARLLVGLALTLQVLIQLGILNHQVAEKVAFFGDYTRIATQLHQLGIKPPCLVQGEQDIPIAYYAGCGSAGSVRAALHRSGGAEPVVVLEYPSVQPPGYARHWRLVQLHGIQSKILRLVAYLPPR